VTQVARGFVRQGVPTIARVVGQLPSKELQKQLQRAPPQVLVGTPQSLTECFHAGVFAPEAVRTVVVDEVDFCLQHALLPAVRPLLQRRAVTLGPPGLGAAAALAPLPGSPEAAAALTHAAAVATEPLRLAWPADCSLVLVSATMTREVVDLANGLLRQDTLAEQGRVSATTEGLPPQLQHIILKALRPAGAAADAADAALFRRWYARACQRPAAGAGPSAGVDVSGGVGPVNGVLVFCGSRDRLTKLRESLREHRLWASALHADSTKDDRRRALTRLAMGKVNILLATDMGSRGLDLPRLTHVYHYDLPRSATEYVHRAGRVGRATPMGGDAAAPTFRPGAVVTPVRTADALAAVRAWTAGMAVAEAEL